MCVRMCADTLLVFDGQIAFSILENGFDRCFWISPALSPVGHFLACVFVLV